MPVIYDNAKIIPAPLVTVNEEIVSGPDGRKVGTTYTLTLNGTMVSDMGSPQDGSLFGSNWGGPDDLFWVGSNYPPNELITVGSKLNSIETKQQALRALFSQDGKWLEFQSPNGDAPLKCQPRVRSIQFAEGIWVQTCPYTIVVECDVLYLNGKPVTNTPTHDELISSTSENWQIQEGEVKKTYSVSHTLNAVGKVAFDSLGNPSGYPWEHAKQFVFNRLGIGYGGIGNFSTIPVSSLVISSALGLGSINFNGLMPFNFSRNESIDETAGSYSLTENWIFCPTSGTDNYTISVRRISDEPYTTLSASIQGRIVGYNVDLFDYDQRILSAEWMWSQALPQLYNRVSQYINATGINLNTEAVQATYDVNPIDGTIDYNYSFDNKLYSVSGVFETFTISKKIVPDDYRVAFSINGAIKGRKYDNEIDPSAPFLRARSYFDTLDMEPLLYDRIISSKFYPEASGLGLRIYPLSKSIDFNESDGSINYSYEFNNRQNDGDYFNDIIQDEYRVTRSFNREDGRTIYTINGNIQGLNINGLSREQRFANALEYWNIIAQSSMYSRIFTYYDNANIPYAVPVTTEIEQYKNAATINYSYSYNNKPAPIISGALFESITVSEQNAKQKVQVVARIPIIGRVVGPIIQDMNTTTEKIRSINIEVVLGPTGSTTWLSSFSLKPDYDEYVYQLQPEGGKVQEDNEVWDWINGRYQKNISWVYT